MGGGGHLEGRSVQRWGEGGAQTTLPREASHGMLQAVDQWEKKGL